MAAREQTDLAVLMIDLDHFKRVNDRYGHPEGDRLLRAVGHALASFTLHGETAARVGGEEFALLLPGASSDDAHGAAVRQTEPCTRPNAEAVIAWFPPERLIFLGA